MDLGQRAGAAGALVVVLGSCLQRALSVERSVLVEAGPAGRIGPASPVVRGSITAGLLYNRFMDAKLETVAALTIGKTFSLLPAGHRMDNPEAPDLPRWVCTGIMPISSQQVRRRSRGMGDQYSIYYHVEGTTDGPTAKRVPWNQAVVIYATGV